MWCQWRQWAYSVEKLGFRPKFENISPHSVSTIFRRGVGQKRGSKPCCVSLEPFAAIFTEYSQGRAFGGIFRNPICRAFQQNRPKADLRRDTSTLFDNAGCALPQPNLLRQNKRLAPLGALFAFCSFARGSTMEAKGCEVLRSEKRR
jgi:hypothetical protein